MEAQGKQMSEPFTLEATAALIDLVRLSRRIGSAVSDIPNTIAVILPEQILSLCGAQRGVIFITPHRPPGSVQVAGIQMPRGEP